jgi:hypothetical protein
MQLAPNGWRGDLVPLIETVRDFVWNAVGASTPRRASADGNAA